MSGLIDLPNKCLRKRVSHLTQMSKIKIITIFLKFLMSEIINLRDLVSDKSEKMITFVFDK